MSIRYRSEIDGLRAIAVLAVVLYHAEIPLCGVNLFRGGYVGVDIFFVISGYLITAMVLSDLREQKFSFRMFYERRARRLLPAMFTVMLASAPFAWIYLLTKEMREYAGSVLSSLLFVSNIWFWLEDSYWAEPSALKPFLHTWSLSIEGQFYFLFPALVVLLWKYARQRILHLFTVLALLTLLLAESFTPKMPEFTFFLLPARAWELLAGAVLAQLEAARGKAKHQIFDRIAPIFGLLLIFISIYCFDIYTQHPSFMTLLPVVGSMLIIWFARSGTLAGNLLQGKWLVRLGLISYSFYLWHYPVFAFSRIRIPAMTRLDKMGLIALSLGLAILTFFIIERPVRRRTAPGRVVVPSLAVAGVVLLAAFSFLYVTDGAKFRFEEASRYIDYDYWAKSRGNRNYYYTFDKCWLDRRDIADGEEPFARCRSQEPKERNFTILVVGDSNVAGLIPGLVKNYGRNNIVQRVVNACLPEDLEGASRNRFCKAAYRHIYAELEEIDPDLILIGGRYRNEMHIRTVMDVIRKYFSRYRDRVFLLGPLPRWGEAAKSRWLPRQLTDLYFSSERSLLNGAVYLEPDSTSFALDDYAEKLTAQEGVGYLSPVRSFCNMEQQVCLAKQDGDGSKMTAWDYGHLTVSGSLYFVDSVRDALKKKLNK